MTDKRREKGDLVGGGGGVKCGGEQKIPHNFIFYLSTIDAADAKDNAAAQGCTMHKEQR